MTDAMNLHNFPSRDEPADPGIVTPAPRPALVPRHEPIGHIIEVGGSGASVEIVGRRLSELATDKDLSIAMSGQVGSQIKIGAGSRWLLANVRKLKITNAEAGHITAEIDFLGEGDEDRASGKLVNFKRGITSYPIPGSKAYPVSGDDLKQMFAADERAHVEIGTVYPTKDVRAALYVDALLGKHFALLGSTGTGKSTSAALIMHRICDMSPEGHIVMVDPHGEYSAAFEGNGAIYDVSNLAMPYWLMNFEEHCEVFVTSSGSNRQMDADILAKCLLAAKAKNRAAEGVAKLTVDSPIPYLLSDLTNLIQLEMGKLDKAGDSAPYMRL